MAEATKTSLKESNDLLKADNTKMDKRIKELEKLEKAVNQAERFKNSILEFFQNKYKDADNKKRPTPFPSSCPSHFKSTLLHRS